MQDNKVIWLEGMFLQPQHFQQQDRYFENLIHSKIQSLEKNGWGFSELQVDTQLLSIGKISVSLAKGYFQDGTAFDIPEKDSLPVPYNIPEGINNNILYLAIPNKQQHAEVGDATAKELFRYQVQTAEIVDCVAGSHPTAELQLGKLACRILSEHDDRSAFHCLQFSKVLESRSNQHISFDKNFLPHCIEVRAAAHLSQIITEVHGLLNHRAEMLAGRLTDTQHAGTAEIVDFMLLQLINRYEPIFYCLQHKKTCIQKTCFH